MKQSDGTKTITDVVYGPTGGVIVAYTKHHLFPTEMEVFTPGPFAPTVFALPYYPTYVIGCVICYEAEWPLVSGDWSQFDSLKEQGATIFAWSIGDATPQPAAARALSMATKSWVVESENNHIGVVTMPDGNYPSDSVEAPVNPLGYTAAAQMSMWIM